MNALSGFTMQPLEIVEADPTSAECRMLLAAHDYFASTRRSDADYKPCGAAELKSQGVKMFLARHMGQPVGCAVLSGEGVEREISRVYTVEAARHRRVAQRMMSELERVAKETGARLLKLEAGRWQTEALDFFEGYGFQPAPPFGRFANQDDRDLASRLFYEKPL